MGTELAAALWALSVGICSWIGFRDGDVIRGLGAGALFGPLGIPLLLWLVQSDNRWRESQE